MKKIIVGMLIALCLIGCAAKNDYIKVDLIDGTVGYRFLLEDYRIPAQRVCLEGYDVIKKERETVIVRCIDVYKN